MDISAIAISSSIAASGVAVGTGIARGISTLCKSMKTREERHQAQIQEAVKSGLKEHEDVYVGIVARTVEEGLMKSAEETKTLVSMALAGHKQEHQALNAFALQADPELASKLGLIPGKERS